MTDIYTYCRFMQWTCTLWFSLWQSLRLSSCTNCRNGSDNLSSVYAISFCHVYESRLDDCNHSPVFPTSCNEYVSVSCSEFIPDKICEYLEWRCVCVCKCVEGEWVCVRKSVWGVEGLWSVGCDSEFLKMLLACLFALIDNLFFFVYCLCMLPTQRTKVTILLGLFGCHPK